MPRTQKSLDKNLSKLTTTTKETKVRKTRSDKKPVFTKVKSNAKDLTLAENILHNMEELKKLTNA